MKIRRTRPLLTVAITWFSLNVVMSQLSTAEVTKIAGQCTHPKQNPGYASVGRHRRDICFLLLWITKVVLYVIVSNLGSGASAGRSFTSGNQADSVVTQEGLTVVVVKGNISDQAVRFHAVVFG